MNIKFLIKKIITSILTLLLLACVTFFIFEIIPGDAVISKLGTEATEESIARMREMYGLDKSFASRFFSFAAGLFTGDFGISYSTGNSVAAMLWECLPVTISLALMSLLLVIVFSVPIGLLTGAAASGRKKKSMVVFDVANQIFMSVPPFFIGIIISIVFGLKLQWFVPGKYVSFEESFTDFIVCLIPAAVAVAVPKIAMMVKFVKSTVMDEMNKDYVRCARSKGMSEVRVLFSHVFKNVIITNVTALSVVIVEIFAGSVVIEQVFSLPGLGRLLVISINTRDFKVVSAIVMYIGVVVILANLLSDIIYTVVDKRTEGGTNE